MLISFTFGPYFPTQYIKRQCIWHSFLFSFFSDLSPEGQRGPWHLLIMLSKFLIHGQGQMILPVSRHAWRRAKKFTIPQPHSAWASHHMAQGTSLLPSSNSAGPMEVPYLGHFALFPIHYWLWCHPTQSPQLVTPSETKKCLTRWHCFLNFCCWAKFNTVNSSQVTFRQPWFSANCCSLAIQPRKN